MFSTEDKTVVGNIYFKGCVHVFREHLLFPSCVSFTLAFIQYFSFSCVKRLGEIIIIIKWMFLPWTLFAFLFSSHFARMQNACDVLEISYRPKSWLSKRIDTDINHYVDTLASISQFPVLRLIRYLMITNFAILQPNHQFILSDIVLMHDAWTNTTNNVCIKCCNSATIPHIASL